MTCNVNTHAYDYTTHQEAEINGELVIYHTCLCGQYIILHGKEFNVKDIENEIKIKLV